MLCLTKVRVGRNSGSLKFLQPLGGILLRALLCRSVPVSGLLKVRSKWVKSIKEKKETPVQIMQGKDFLVGLWGTKIETRGL